MLIINEPIPQGKGSCSGPGRQETMGGAMAHIRFEGAPIQSSDPPLSTSNTVGNRDDMMEHAIELTDLVLDLEKVKTAQAHVIASLKKRVTKVEQSQSSRISGFYPFRASTSRRHSLGRRSVSKQGRKNLKSQQKFQDIDDLVDEEVIVEDNGSGEKRGSTAEIVSTARPDISAARLNISAARAEVSTAAPKTPPTTITLFDDEDVTDIC
nr:hypothetical protein [Tanacetum cinerariifolium]